MKGKKWFVETQHKAKQVKAGQSRLLKVLNAITARFKI